MDSKSNGILMICNFFSVLFLHVVVFALFVCFFFVVKSRFQIFCNTSFSKKRKGNGSYGRNNFTSLFFPCSFYKGDEVV